MDKFAIRHPVRKKPEFMIVFYQEED